MPETIFRHRHLDDPPKRITALEAVKRRRNMTSRRLDVATLNYIIQHPSEGINKGGAVGRAPGGGIAEWTERLCVITHVRTFRTGRQDGQPVPNPKTPT